MSNDAQAHGVDEMPPQEKQHRVRDIGIRLLRAGAERPLLFLHDATGMPPWNAFFEKLASHYDVLARKSHRTNARLGGYFERRVCSVVSMPAGGAGRREECWTHFALPAQRRSGLGGPWDDAARTTLARRSLAASRCRPQNI